jgi:single-stranded DNA-binding protein
MSRCVNAVTLLGNCGKDPDIRFTASGKPVAKLSLAINENYKDNQGKLAGAHPLDQCRGLETAGRGRG